MRFDGWDTIEGRHLVFVYASVILIQGGYLLWVITRWLKLRNADRAEQ
jgi:drug/metabolite transporter superfamily protein YnfA